MDLSIKETARILNVSENTVRNYIAWGKLPAQLKDRQLVVPESGVHAFLKAEAEPEAPEDSSDGAQAPLAVPLWAILPVVDRLSALEKQMEERWALLDKNRELLLELRRKEGLLAEKEREIEKLERDLLYQEKLWDKECEGLQRTLEEKWTVKEQETEGRLSREREYFEQQLALERNRWTEKLSQVQETHARELVEVRRRESLWSKLVKMMTWSEIDKGEGFKK